AAPPDIPIWSCEGEKDSDNTAALGLVATTNPGGAGKWSPDLNQWFKGKQCVYIAEDNDAPGRAHARKVADALSGIVPDVRIISFPELPEKNDISDWLAQGHTRQELLDRAKAAPKYERLKSYTLVCASDIIARPLDWIWPGHILRGSQELLTG